MTIDGYRSDLARRNQRGLSFILSSILLWTGIFFVWFLPNENILTRNLFTFFVRLP